MPVSIAGFAVAEVFARQEGVQDRAALNRIGIAGALGGLSPIGLVTTLVLARREAEAEATQPPAVPPGPGQVRVEVPDVVGEEFAAAEDVLQVVGLKARRQNANSRTTATGFVITQQPAPPATLPSGGEVILTVSQGFLMPDVVTKSLADAEQLLAASGVKIVASIDESASGPPDKVIGQQPKPNERISPGPNTVVTLTLSPPPAEVLDLVQGANSVVPSVNEDAVKYGSRVAPANMLQSILELKPGAPPRFYSPRVAPGAAAVVNDLKEVTRLKPVFVFVTADAKLSQPAL